jgi:hypothetical protein
MGPDGCFKVEMGTPARAKKEKLLGAGMRRGYVCWVSSPALLLLAEQTYCIKKILIKFSYIYSL